MRKKPEGGRPENFYLSNFCQISDVFDQQIANEDAF